MPIPYTPRYRKRDKDGSVTGNYRSAESMIDNSVQGLVDSYGEEMQAKAEQKKQASDFLQSVKNPVSTISTSYGATNPVVPNTTGASTPIIENPLIKQDPGPSTNIDWRKNIADEYEKSNQRYQTLLEEDEKARKTEGARKRIGAVADAIAGVANMWGVSRGAHNQQNPQSYSLISDSIVRDRNLRTAELARANERVNNALRQMRMSQTSEQDAAIREMNARTRAQNAETSAGNLAYKNNKLSSDEERTQASNDTKVQVANINAQSRENVARINSGTRITTTGMNNQTSIIVAGIRKNGSGTPASKILASTDWDATKNSMFESLYGTSDRAKMTPEQKREYDELKKTKSSVENFLGNHPEVAESIGGGQANEPSSSPANHKKNPFGDAAPANQQSNHKKNPFD